jgi:F-type H+-transporting ATPase subunit b
MEILPIQVLLQAVNFGLVLFILVKFLYKPIANVLEARSQKIKEGIDAAEANVADREKMETTIKNEVAKAKKEAAKIIADAKKVADEQAAEIIAKAKREAKAAADNEKVAFDSMLLEARAKAQVDLKNLVTMTTAQVLQGGLSEADQHKIIESQLKTLKQATFN